MTFIEQIYYSLGALITIITIMCVLIYIIATFNKSKVYKREAKEKLMLWGFYTLIIVWLISIFVIRYNI